MICTSIESFKVKKNRKDNKLFMQQTTNNNNIDIEKRSYNIILSK